MFTVVVLGIYSNVRTLDHRQYFKITYKGRPFLNSAHTAQWLTLMSAGI